MNKVIKEILMSIKPEEISALLKKQIEAACLSRPAILVTGARQTGKSSLLQRMLPKANYVSLDRIVVAAEAEENPSRFLDPIVEILLKPYLHLPNCYFLVS